MLVIKARSALLFAVLIIISSCSDDDTPSASSPHSFTVTIENVFAQKSLIQSGSVEALAPDESLTFEFEAGKAQYLSLATMITETNDAFISFPENGILLYDSQRVPIAGDIAVKMKIFDAGTEENEAPGQGINQGSRQIAPNSGDVENNTIRPITNVNDGFSYPKAKELIAVEISHSDVNKFTVTLTNKSTSSALTTTLSEVVWAIHGENQTPIFSEQNRASNALERLAEDGNISLLLEEFQNETGLTSALSGGAFSIGQTNHIFEVGNVAGEALELLAEDGIPSRFDNIFNIPLQASSPRSINPGESFQFSLLASPDEAFSFASMVIESNDWFIGADQIPLFVNAIPVSGDLSVQLSLFDAGTEVDEFPGAGNTQGARQAALNTGSDQMSTIHLAQPVNMVVPSIEKMVRISIQPE